MKSPLLLALFCSLVIILVLIGPVLAFTPNEIAIVYNTNPTMLNASHGVALYYAQARGIPQTNIVGINSPSSEEMWGSQYIQYIATPIWNYLSTHPNIKVIVLCYGIPFRISDSSGSQCSVDAALKLLGNPNILNITRWWIVHGNPFYNSSVSWDIFKDSTTNSVDIGGGQTWKVNYLVSRLDGFSQPTTNVVIDDHIYCIPSDIKDMIDSAERANNTGIAGLIDATAVIDDAVGSNWTHYPSTVTTLNNLFQPITCSSDNVCYLTNDSYSYAVNKQNVIAYSSAGNYDHSADLATTWYRPHNAWKDGAVALYWNVSTSGSYIRAINFYCDWGDAGSDTNPANIEPGIFKVKALYHPSSPYDGTVLRLYGSTHHELLAETQFQGGIARIDMRNMQWPSDHMTYFERRFPSSDLYHPNEAFASVDLREDLYKAQFKGYTYNAGEGQSRSVELIRDGASATLGNVQEPGAGANDPNIILPKYVSGFTWAESALMGVSGLCWQDVAIGDPLMAPLATPPVVEITAPSADGMTIPGTALNVAVTATPVNATGINRIEFWLTDGVNVNALLATDNTSPYGFVFDTTTLLDGRYLLQAAAYEDTDTRECGRFSRPVIINNGGSPINVNINSPASDGITLSNTATIAVSAAPSPAKVELWLHNAARDIKIGTISGEASFNFSFDTTRVPAGSYELQALAYSSTGQVSASLVRQVTVDNSSLIRIAEPMTDGQQKSGKFTVTASTDPNASVAHVDFLLGQNSCRGILIASDTAAPYTCDIDGTTFKNDDYIIRAFAYDSSNVLIGSATPRAVSINNPDLITIVNPSVNDQSVTGVLPVDVTTEASDPAISNVDLWIYGQNATRTITDAASPFNWTIDTTTIPNGSYTLKAIGYKQGGGQVADQPTKIFSINNPNLLSIISPANDGDVVSGTITLAIAAGTTDPDYGRIEIHFTNKNITEQVWNITARTNGRFEYSLNTTSFADGVYTITVYAFKPDGKKVASSVATRMFVINNNHTNCSTSEARALTDSSPCLLAAKVVSVGNSAAQSATENALYVQEPGRSAGIRVSWASTTIPAGKLVTILGTVSNFSRTGERQIVADDIWVGPDATAPIQPLGMNGKSIGGVPPATETHTSYATDAGGLYNAGVLTRVCGKVMYVGSDFIYLEDGSGLQDGNDLQNPFIIPLAGGALIDNGIGVKGLRVYFGGIAKPGIDDYVAITGISSLETIGSKRVRMIRARSANDMFHFDQYIPAKI